MERGEYEKEMDIPGPPRGQQEEFSKMSWDRAGGKQGVKGPPVSETGAVKGRPRRTEGRRVIRVERTEKKVGKAS